MTNKHRGEVEIELGGRTRTLKFTYNALAEVEEELGRAVSDLFSDELRFGVRELRALIAAGLRHEDNRITSHKVGNLMDEGDQGMGYYGTLVGLAVRTALGGNEEEEEGDEKVRPLTGTDS